MLDTNNTFMKAYGVHLDLNWVVNDTSFKIENVIFYYLKNDVLVPIRLFFVYHYWCLQDNYVIYPSLIFMRILNLATLFVHIWMWQKRPHKNDVT